MDFQDLRTTWDEFGKTDPLWAVLTAPDKRHGGWDPDAFFLSGRVEVARVMEKIKAATKGGWSPQGKALDFGCGVGRLTQALASYFDSVVGVDIAPSMIEQARQYNQIGDRCRFEVLPGQDLRMFDNGSFDFVYTAHVLQHMRPDYAHHYVREFLRILRPGGLAIIELPTRRIPGAEHALPPSGFHGQIEVVVVPDQLAAGQTGRVQARVTNTSDCVWPASGEGGWHHVTLGNHWRDARGRVITLDDGRAPLPADLGPGESIVLDLPVHAPTAAGSYTLELDLVQEGVAWFANKGSTVATVDLTVTESLGEDAASVDQSNDEPQMEMYGTPQDALSRIIRKASGRVVSVFDWDEISQSKSTDWERRGYVVVRARNRLAALLSR